MRVHFACNAIHTSQVKLRTSLEYIATLHDCITCLGSNFTFVHMELAYSSAKLSSDSTITDVQILLKFKLSCTVWLFSYFSYIANYKIYLAIIHATVTN